MSPRHTTVEAIHIILAGIEDEIYSTVVAFQTAQEMWEAIERLQQGESLNIQDVKIILFWEFGKFTSHDGESMESYYTRFYKLMNEMIRNNLIQQHKLDEVSYHKLFDILKQYQKEINELRAERLARNANPLALVATAQANQDPYYQTSKSHKSYAPSSKPSIPTRSHITTRYKGKEIAKPIRPLFETAFEEDSDPKQAQKDKDMQKNLASHITTRYKGKEIAKPIGPLFETAFEEDSDPKQAQKDKDMQKNLALIAKMVNVVEARENVGSLVVQQSGIQCFNFMEFRHFAKECRKPKRVKDSAYHKEKIVPLQAEQYDWLADTDEETDEKELEAHYNYMAKIQEVPTTDSGIDSEPFEQNDQNDVESNVKCVALAIVIANLKLDIVQLILFIVDSGCTKHMTGNLKLSCNFVEKFLGTVCFGNDQFAPILGYGDLVHGNITINRVYYVEGLNHNLFLVGQFCDVDLKVAFKKSTCFVRDLQGNDLLIDNYGSDLYTISLQ
nr:integrase, catalytic region, zinc finger, CCHC-type, peptidase aspartic, catalytic [Tanacetum cinerariifolium]